MEKINSYDVFYVMLILRKRYLKEKRDISKFSILINELSKYFEVPYNNIYAHINILLENNFVIKKDNGFIPVVNEKVVKNIFYIYDECRKKQITPNSLFNKKAVEIIKRGLGKKNLILKDIYSDIHAVTLKKYFSLFLKHNFVMVGSSQKPQSFDFNDEILLRIVLKFFGVVPDIDLQKNNKEENKTKEKIIGIVKELNKIKEYKLTKENNFEELNYEQRLHFITHTTLLEGNTMSFQEVKALLEEGKILGNHDIVELDENRNMKRALEFIEEKLDVYSLSLDDIKKTHYILLENLNKKEYEKKGGWKSFAGIIRNYSVYITNNPKFIITKFEDLDNELNEFVIKFNKDLTLITSKIGIDGKSIEEKIKFVTWVHSQFQHIHPFGYGNSRTTRLLFTYTLLSFGFPMIDIYDSYEYMKYTKREEKRDDDILFEFFVSLIYDNLKKMNMKLK